MSYAKTAYRLASLDQWFSTINTSDLFFFPPLFNYLAGLLCLLEIDRLVAVRLISTVFSSGISPLLFFLMRRFNYSRRASFLAATLFIIAPNSFYFSVTGLVEMTMIFFIVLSLFLFCRSLNPSGKLRSRSQFELLFSASTLGLAVWTKETPLGLIPVYLILLRSDKKLLLKWLSVFLVTISPLVLYSLFSRRYNLLSEIPFGQFDIRNWNADIILRRLVKIVGGDLTIFKSFGLVLFQLFAYLLIRSFVSLTRDQIRRDVLLRFNLLSLAIYVVFFVAFKKKFEHHSLLIFLFCLPPLALYLDRSSIFVRYTCVGLISLSLAYSSLNRCSTIAEKNYLVALQKIEDSTSGAQVYMPMPNIAEYLYQKRKLKLSIVNLGDITMKPLSRKEQWQEIRNLRFDYFLVQRYWAARYRLSLKKRHKFRSRFGLPKLEFHRVKNYGHLVLYKAINTDPKIRKRGTTRKDR
ncbi:MAG: phospholipid carrier-dependent glycosyltransferase [Proteobacteria bacterium]|nr:phospholipid carrier-dependent glycosyltransferase [Pseudomonadota bacterium]